MDEKIRIEMREATRELLYKWIEMQSKWVEKFGTEEGFSEWFKLQLKKLAA